jgi:hypothetical protein
MTRPRTKFDVSPRGLTENESADYLGLGQTEFKRLLPKLEAEGFPKRDRLTGRRDWKAIEHWWDQRSGLAKDGAESGLLARIEEFRHAA